MNAPIAGEAADDEQVVFYLTSASKPYWKAAPRAERYGVGSLLAGKYRLDSMLGQGSIGTVWQATNLLLDSPVAIKLTHADLAGPAFRARLQLEARAAAGVGHPAIVRVFDVGETDLGDPFIVMELLQGATLAQMIAGGSMTAVRAVQIVLPIVDALAAMHARGIVHRDVKPDNLFVAMEDRTVQPKLLDFGIAKLDAPRGKPENPSESGMLVGSPEYMSPEQATASDDVDFRTDIWSVCVALYESMSGQTPFAAASYEELLGAITEMEPASLADRGVCDEQLWDIIRIGLAKDRYARHASMTELGRALASWLVGHGVTEDACGISLESKWFAGDPVPPFAASADANTAELVAPARRAESATSVPPSSRAATRSVLRHGRALRIVRVLAVAAVLAGALFAVTSKRARPDLAAIGKGATETGVRLAASAAAEVLALASPSDSLRESVTAAAAVKVSDALSANTASSEVAEAPTDAPIAPAAAPRPVHHKPVAPPRRHANLDLLVPY